MSLISPEALHERLADPRLRIADVRWYLGKPGAGRAEYEQGHLPGAVFVDLDADLSAPTGPGRHPLPDPAVFAARMGELGIGSGDLVVAYDDAGGGVAARLWWMLDDLGHRDEAVLDGGIGAWTAAGFPMTQERPSWPPTHLELAGRWSGLIDRQTLTSRLGSVVLLDGRAGPRYRGEIEPVDPVAGHIPSAISAPIGENLGPDGRFLPPTVLAERFHALGCTAHEVVTSCGSGTNACQTALAMRVAGLPDPLLYPGSYSDWSRAGMPVAIGPEPGAPPVS
jgi:thiosulfate/3-mercaptopyruvate sulfurtransferase